MAGLDIALLGAPTVTVDGRPLQVDTRKAVALLAYLAVEGTSKSRDTLAALLWPEADEPGSKSALRRTLSALKSGLDGRWLDIDRHSVRFESGGATVDVRRLRDLLAQAAGHAQEDAAACADCRAAITEAVGLYRGDFLAGFGLRDSPDFEEWQALTAERLREELALALEHLAVIHEDAGEIPEALGFARRRLSLDPLNEPAHQAIMRLHALRGDRAAALAQYRDCLRLLDEELGVPPLEETTRLYQDLLAGRATRVPTPPAAATPSEAVASALGALPLVGRNAELRAMLGAYQGIDADGAVVAIEGEAGIGKTRLADEFIERVGAAGGASLQSRCYEGEVNLPLAPIVGLLRSGIASPDARRRIATLPRDDLAEAARLVPELLPAGSTSPPIDSPAAQSRFFDGVLGVLCALVGGDRPGVVAVEDLHWADEASTTLLAYFARRLTGRPTCLLLTWRSEELAADHPLRRVVTRQSREGRAHVVRPGRLDETAVRRLVGSLDIPGEKATNLAPRLLEESEGLPFFLVQYLSALVEGSERQAIPAGIRALLHSRLARVTGTDAQVLGTAAVIGRSFSFDVLRAAGARSDDETVAAIEALTAQGFLRASEADETGERLDFTHEKLRSFVYEELSGPRRRILHGRIADALIRYGAAGRNEAPAAQVAQHLRLAGRDRQAAEYFEIAAVRAKSLGANSEALAHYEAALACGHPAPAALYQEIAELHTLAGSYDSALASYQSAAALTAPGDIPAIEHRIGGLYLRTGRWDLAREHLALAAEGLLAGAPALLARALADQSLAAHRQGDDAEARSLAQRALELATSAPDPLAIAQARNIAGVLAAGSGDLDGALEELRLSLEAATAAGDPGARIAASNNIALVLRANGDLAAAEDLTRTALALCVRYGDRHREAALRNNLADILRDAGQHDEAMAALKAAVAIFAEVGMDRGTFEPEEWKLVEW